MTGKVLKKYKLEFPLNFKQVKDTQSSILLKLKEALVVEKLKKKGNIR